MLALNDLLVARDFSPASDRILRQALDLAARAGATLHVLYAEILHREVTKPDTPASPAEDLDEVREELKHETDVSAEALDAVSVQEVVRKDVRAAPAILNYASDADVDLIVLGTHGREGTQRFMIGSVAEEVVRHAKWPVLTVWEEDNSGELSSGIPIDRILAPLDFSDHSRDALRHAREWAGLYGSHLDLLHVIEDELHPAFYIGGMKTIYEVEPNVDEKARKKLEASEEKTGGASPDIESHVSSGVASTGIAEFVEEHDVDLVTMSTHGRTGIQRFLLGSVAEKVVRHVSCSVLTVSAFGASLVSSSEEHSPSDA